MSTSRRVPKANPMKVAGGVLTSALLLAACGAGTSPGEGAADSPGDEVVIEFLQWWEPELPDGEFRALVDRFEEEHPGIKIELLSQPFNSVKDQVIAGSATGILPDVIGIDGDWVSDFVKQGAITEMSSMIADTGFDTTSVVSEVQVGGETFMLPVVNFLFPMFVNMGLLEQAGVTDIPSTYSEFAEAAAAIGEVGTNVSGTSIALGLENPTGVGNDFMPWVWSPDGSMLTADGQPDLTNDRVAETVTFLKEQYDSGVMSPGIFTMARQDEVEEFQAGRLGMFMGSLAHINLFQTNNPDLEFTVTTVPTPDDYSGDIKVKYASWGVGISDTSENKDEAWTFVQWLFDEATNDELAVMANAFPGNVNVQPDLSDADPTHVRAFEIWQQNVPVNEFEALPQVSDLQRHLGEELHHIFNGDKTVEDGLQDAQEYWESVF